MKASLNPRDLGHTGATHDVRGSQGASGGGVTYSTLANIPRHKRNKLVQEAKPMVQLPSVITVVCVVGRSQEVQRDLVCN